MTRDPEKKANASQKHYYRNRARLVQAAKDRYQANREQKIEYQRHYRLVARTIAEDRHPPRHAPGFGANLNQGAESPKEMRMGATRTPGTMPGALTPICNDCGIALCWDIAEEEYFQNSRFWDAWKCETCSGGEKFTRKAFYQNPANSKQETER